MREPSHPFADPRVEAVRLVIARGLAQRIPADTLVRELIRDGHLGDVSADLDHEAWRP